MKKIIVIAKYEAYVPDDITVSQISELCKKEIRNNLDDFRISVPNYHDEEEGEPWFELDDVMVGTESTITIGGE